MSADRLIKVRDLCRVNNPEGLSDALKHIDPNAALPYGYATQDISPGDSYRALHIACIHKTSVEAVRVLLDAGADVNVRNFCGRTPLYYAGLHGGHEAIIKLLFQRGAKPPTDTQSVGYDLVCKLYERLNESVLKAGLVTVLGNLHAVKYPMLECMLATA